MNVINVHGEKVKINKYFTWKRSTFMVSYWILFGMRNVTDKSCTDQNTRLMFNYFFFFFLQKSRRLWDNVEKYGKAIQATDDNTG